MIDRSLKRRQLLRATGTGLSEPDGLSQSHRAGGVPEGDALGLFETGESPISGSMADTEVGLVGGENAGVSGPATGMDVYRRGPRAGAVGCVGGDLG